jgi:hypothetical protein
MSRRGSALVSEIQLDALRSDVPLSDTLRKVIALGGQLGSASLRDWASLELRGYVGGDVELPAYRKPGALIQVDAVNPRFQMTGQTISPHQLPEGVRDVVEEAIPLGQPIAEIEGLVDEARANGGHIRMSPPGAAMIARMMDREIGEPYQNITAVYWSVSTPALQGVLDQVRTTLVELMAEMEAGTEHDDEAPSAAVADQAVNVVIHGKGARVNVTSAQASGDAAQATANPDTAEKRSIPRLIGAIVVGIATVAAAVIALLQWQGWGL